LNNNVLGVLLPYLPQDLVQPGRDDHVLIAAAALATAVAALLAGPLADRAGRRLLLIAGMAAFALASALHVLAQSYGVLVGARAVRRRGRLRLRAGVRAGRRDRAVRAARRRDGRVHGRHVPGASGRPAAGVVVRPQRQLARDLRDPDRDRGRRRRAGVAHG